ncbi:hypothetical protein H5410_052761 [Solanum commersonii]|uniref:Uncharacterized protein n=1 Tax=Solanum commersonii TaxID=4109 RepID=A0A9J5X4J1_SOLCO|nr:hypothetical protein H5410_052761 [Solanum commersonii]
MSITGAITAYSTNIWMDVFILKVDLEEQQLELALLSCPQSSLESLVSSVSQQGVSFFTNFGLYKQRIFFIFGLLYLQFYMHFVVNESPRWQRNKEGFIQTLHLLKLFRIIHGIRSTPQQHDRFIFSYKDLMERNWSFRRLINVCWIWYWHSMPLGVGCLNFNLYISITINALSELPSSILILLFIGKCSLLGFAMLSGIFSIGCVIIDGGKFERLQIAHSIDLHIGTFPNSAVAMVLGGALSSMLIAVGRNNEWLSFGVFGLSIATCGCFVVFLPETKGRTLSDTMDEEENKDITFVC